MYLLNPEHKYIIHIYPKSGCTLVRLIHLYLINGKSPDDFDTIEERNQFENVHHYTKNYVETKFPDLHPYSCCLDTDIYHPNIDINTYQIFQIFRNPYERLCSTFYQKYVGVQSNQNNISQICRGNTFKTFLKQVNSINDVHFYPQKKIKADVYLNIKNIDKFPNLQFQRIRTQIVNINKLDKYIDDDRLEGVDLVNYDFTNDSHKLIIDNRIPDYKYLLTADIKKQIRDCYNDDFYYTVDL